MSHPSGLPKITPIYKMAGTNKKVIVKKQTNPVFSDVNKQVAIPKRSGASIPRRLISTQPMMNAYCTLRAQMNGNLVSYGSALYYTNLPFYCTLKNVNSLATFAGYTNLAARYDYYIPMKIKVKLTLVNYNNVPCVCYLFPSRSLVSASSSSIQTEYRVPYAKKLTLGLPSSNRAVGTLMCEANLSTLYGYNITQTNSSNFLTQFGNDPSWNYSGVHLVVVAADGSSIPSVDWTATVDVTVIPVSYKALVN